MWTRIRAEERGIALVVTMLVMMVVLSLSAAVVQLAQGENLQSARSKKSVEAAQAVDTALAEWLSVLPTTIEPALICDSYDYASREAASPGTGYVAVDIGAGYPQEVRLDIMLEDEDGAVFPCTGYTDQILNLATVTATSKIGTASKDSAEIARKFEVSVELDPQYGAGISTAIYGACNVTLTGNKTVLEEVAASNDADIYAGCNIYADTNLGNSSLFEGSFVAWNNIYIAGMYLGGNIWARGDIIGSGGACVGLQSDGGCGYGDNPADYAGNALDETGWIVSTKGDINANGYVLNPCVAPSGTITQPGGPAMACRLRDWVSGPDIYKLLSGAVPPGFYPAPYSCPAGAVSLMGKNLCQDPPKITFPRWSWNPADWAGFTQYNVTTCLQAQTDIENGFPGPTLVDLRGMTPDCDLTFNGGGAHDINGDLGIITEGAVHFQSMSWNGVGGTHKVMVIHPTTETAGTLNSCPYKYDDAGNPSAYGADAQDDVTFSNQTSFTNLKTMFYSPCAITLDNLSHFDGQVIAGTATTSNNGNLQFKKVEVPGLGSPQGYNALVLYQQELPHL